MTLSATEAGLTADRKGLKDPRHAARSGLLAGLLGVAVLASGCVSSGRQVVVVPPEPVAGQPSVKRISSDGLGGLSLPDGTRVTVDASGGFSLPNGDYVRRDRAGGLNLPNGSRCTPDRQGGYLCP